MKISLEIIDVNNSFVNKKFEVTDEYLLDIKIMLASIMNISIESQTWYLDGNIIDDYYNDWCDKEYLVIIENMMMELKIIYNNKHTDIVVNENIKVKELKNILSLDDNIYYRNIMLDDDTILNKINFPYPLIIKSSTSACTCLSI
jgi:hypothetical protein